MDMSTKVQNSQDLNTFQLIDRYKEEKVIYSSFGDNRKNLYEITDSTIKKLAKSVACLISAPKHLEENSDKATYTLKGVSLAERPELNKPGNNVHFAREPSLGRGTAFLVSADLALTAGHCVCKKDKSEVDPDLVKNTRLVFGFQMNSATDWNHTVEEKNVHKFEVLDFRNLGKDGDWALLRLNRAIDHITPLTVNFINIVTGTPNIYMLGHPSGLPLKFAEKGRVQIVPNTGTERFQAIITAYTGNSGSPVFNAENNEVIGILVAGNKDFDGSIGNQTDHEVTFQEIQSKGYEKCQRTSALPGSVVEKISKEILKTQKEADNFHNEAVQDFNSNKRKEAMRNFINSGDLGLHQSYLNAIVLSRGWGIPLPEKNQYSGNFYTYLQSTEASAAGIKLDKSAEVIIIAEVGGHVSAQRSHYGAGAVGDLRAKDGGITTAEGVTTLDNAILSVYSGQGGKSTASHATLGENASLTVLTNPNAEELQEAEAAAKSAKEHTRIRQRQQSGKK